jgi:hypothetical protein
MAGKNAGRPRKSGKRFKCGKLRAPEQRLERPSAWVAAQYARFGVHYCWALGRAYASGLLGDGAEALNRYQAAKRFVRLYQRFFGGAAYACPLDDSPRGENVVSLDVSEHQENDRRWLAAAMDSMDVSGCRPYFDQLISAVNVDRGPHLLDAMIAVGDFNEGLSAINAERRKDGKAPLVRQSVHPLDQMVLAAALQALDMIAPQPRPARILAGYY